MSELRGRIADWRYTGFLRSSGGSIALVQQMRFPDRRLRVVEGESIHQVKVERVFPDRIVVSFAEDREEVFLDRGDPFDLSSVAVPRDLADRPEALVNLVFAQTLGQYLPEDSSATPSQEVDGDSENDALAKLAEINGWSEPFYGETTETFAERLTENFPGPGSEQGRGIAPHLFRLTEETRVRMFGFGNNRN